MSDAAPPPLWWPTREIIDRAHVTACARSLGLADYPAFHRWSVDHRDRYWELVMRRLGIVMQKRPEAIADRLDVPSPTWLAGGRMNIVESCFLADSDAIAIVQSDGRGAIESHTVDALRRLTARVATALIADGLSPGEAVGVVMPMTFRSVATYLGVIAAGGAVVSIADSFAAGEIAGRLKLAGAGRVFTQDVIQWGSKRLPLYEKVCAAGGERIVVLRTQNGGIRTGDGDFESFLSEDDQLRAVERSPQDTINVLFSSGTTADPKAIPWDHTTPIKCAADGHFHQDLHPGDVACWPTNLGWMMGPWLIFASLINRATMALFAQTPVESAFGKFVEDAQVTMLGGVPSLVRAWRQSKCMEGFDWSSIRAFSSSGECSNPEDTRYLMQLAGNKPMIEYCGGTEIGGAYVTGTVVQPCVPSTFTTAALGLDFVLLDDEGKCSDRGEVFIEGPSIGLSSRLLNRDHDSIYYGGTPRGNAGLPLRRHGDALERVGEHSYRVTGRSDDTMNLGGVKVGCAEIERVLNALPGITETAAVATAPPGGGPSKLTIFAVISDAGQAAAGTLKTQFQKAISAQLNPLFHVDSVVLVDALPRTTSNKIIRRSLRIASR